MNFDIVIPTYNNYNNLLLCLKSLEQQTYKNFRVFVCIDGSTDCTFEKLNSQIFNFDITILQHNDKQNHGRSQTRNLALEYLKAKWILLLDSDVIADKNMILAHYNLLKDNDCISQGDLYYNNQDNIWAYYTQRRGKFKYNRYDILPKQYFTTNVAFRADYFQKLKGFDTNFFNSWGGEDTDLALKLNLQFELKSLYNPESFCNTTMDLELKDALVRLETFGSQNMKILLSKYPEQNLFNFTLLERKITSKALRFFIKIEDINRLILSISEIKAIPLKIRYYAVHYLVFRSIYLGFNK